MLGVPGVDTEALLSRAGGISHPWGKFTGVSLLLFYVRWSKEDVKLPVFSVLVFVSGADFLVHVTVLRGFPTGQ